MCCQDNLPVVSRSAAGSEAAGRAATEAGAGTVPDRGWEEPKGSRGSRYCKVEGQRPVLLGDVSVSNCSKLSSFASCHIATLSTSRSTLYAVLGMHMGCLQPGHRMPLSDQLPDVQSDQHLDMKQFQPCFTEMWSANACVDACC